MPDMVISVQRGEGGLVVYHQTADHYNHQQVVAGGAIAVFRVGNARNAEDAVAQVIQYAAGIGDGVFQLFPEVTVALATRKINDRRKQ
jgi:hypothetical protein